MKALVFRALKYSGNWLSFDLEVQRIKMMLVSNDFQVCVIYSVVQSSLSRCKVVNNNLQTDYVMFCTRLYNLKTMKSEENVEYYAESAPTPHGC